MSDLSDLSVSALKDLTSQNDWNNRARFRAMARRSLYFFIKNVTCWAEKNIMTKEAFFDSCTWLQWVVTTKKRGLFEDPRDHIKSTRSTVAIPKWLAIQRPNPAHDLPAEVDRASRYLEEHPNLHGPDSCLAIVCESFRHAKDWTAQSKTHWETNPILRWAFPELVWGESRDYGRWADEEYHLPGRNNPTLRDGFLRAIGIESAESGSRVIGGLFIDDLVSEKSNESPTELAYRVKFTRSITQLLKHQDYNEPAGDFVLYVNNRWNLDDPNSMIHDELEDWAVWHRGASKCIVHGLGNCGRRRSDAEKIECGPEIDSATGKPVPIWPEMHPDLEAIRRDKGDIIYFTQWENDPVKKGDLDASKFVPFRLEVRSIDGERMMCAIVEPFDHDGTSVVKHVEIIPLRQLSGHYISIDPASADEDSEARKKGKTARHAAVWTAIDKPTGRVFVLDCRAGHWPPEEAIRQEYDAWYDACQSLQGKVGVLCEKVGAQIYVALALKSYAQGKGVSLIIPKENLIKRAGGASKDHRILSRVGHRLGQYKLYLRDGLTLPRQEARHFPTGSKDTLDAIANAEEKYLEMHGGHAMSDTLRKRRMRLRKMRRQAATSTGVPL